MLRTCLRPFCFGMRMVPSPRATPDRDLTYAMHDKDNSIRIPLSIMISDFQPCLYGWWNIVKTKLF